MNTFVSGEKVTAQAVNENFSSQSSRLQSLVDLYSPHYLPVNIISVWSGSEESIPSGWVLCDGTNNSPDLRNKFIVGAGENYSLAQTAGQDFVSLTTDHLPSHSHGVGTFTADESGAHTHSYNRNGRLNNMGPGGRNNVWSRTTTASTGSAGLHQHSFSGESGQTGSGSPHENRPPFYSLCYIMLVGES